LGCSRKNAINRSKHVNKKQLLKIPTTT
jgi:hypothetical protein